MKSKQSCLAALTVLQIFMKKLRQVILDCYLSTKSLLCNQKTSMCNTIFANIDAHRKLYCTD